MPSALGEIVLAEEDVAALRKRLLGKNIESCAILYANEVKRRDNFRRFLVREIEFPNDDEYTRRGPTEAELSPSCVARVSKKARRSGMSIFFSHSHPGIYAPHFSPVDNAGEKKLSAFLALRNPERTHGALVISQGGFCARQIGSEIYLRVIGLGSARELLFDPEEISSSAHELYDRQIRAFGEAGHAAIEKLRIAIVGLGGTGSIVAEQLAHLGVRDFILIDPDKIESTNLNRVVNSHAGSLHKAKVDVAADYILKLSNSSKVSRVQGDLTHVTVAAELLEADLIFGCTDSHGSRSVMQQIAYQYLIPCIDMGTVITVTNGAIRHIIGRSQLLAPGLGCLTCSGLLDPAEVRRDMMTDYERKQDPYLQGTHEPAPAVISINGTIASLAVTMFLAVITGIPVSARHLLYDAITSKLRSVRADSQVTCYTCSRQGAFARGDSWPLLGRQN